MAHGDTEDRAPLRVGLTGGIASGKSTVADMFAGLGAVLIDTDVIARDVVAPGEPALEAIRAEFGDEIIGADSGLDRARMRSIVFADDRARARLEAIVHPRIRDATLARSMALSADDGDGYQIIVVPLLVESPLASFMDRIAVVDCSEATQIRRLMARDAESEGQARRMLAAQSSREQRLAVADDVISNEGDLNATLKQVRTLHRRYLALARRGRRRDRGRRTRPQAKTP